MALDNCADEIKAALGRPLSKEEAATVADLMKQLERRVKQERIKAQGADAEAAVLKAVNDMSAEMAAAAAIEKRNAALNLRKQLEGTDYVKSQWAAEPETGIEAMLVGVNTVRPGSRNSAAGMQRELRGWYIGGALADLEKAGVREVFASGALDRDVARALWSLDNPAAPPFKGPKEAEAIAGIVRKWQEEARHDANLAGAWIKQMPGYIVRQSHDLWKIQAAGYERWKAAVLPKLDMERVLADMPDANAQQFLKATYDGLASGVHMKAAPSPAFKGPRNLGKAVSHERVLHFKSADDWLDYNNEFGTGNLREAFFAGLDRMGETTGLMRALGPNPESNLRQIADSVRRGITEPRQVQAFEAFTNGKMANLLAQVDGSVNIPGNAMAARIAANTRGVVNMSRLGQAVVSSVTDVPVYASELAYQGRGFLSGMAEALGALAQGRPKGERAQILSSLGVVQDSIVGDIATRFSANDTMGGKMTRWQRQFFRLNGLSWWTETLRASAALGMSHHLALNAGRMLKNLDPDLQRVLRLFGIDEGKWDILRATKTKDAEGRAYLVPEGVRDLPDERFSAYLESTGVKATPAKIRDLKVEIESQLRSYYVDRAQTAVLEPDERTRAFMLQGTRPGTFYGELARFIGQFKSFSVGFTQRVIGREIYGRGSDTFAEALNNGNGEMVGLARLIAMTTLFGYGAMAAKDMLKGREPRDPLSPKTWTAAMVQGGGAGIFGDFLFGEANRFGGGFIATAAGPVLGSAEDVIDIWNRLRTKIEEGDAGKGGDVAATTFRTVVNNTPFLNLFYTRAALDYLVLHSVTEMLNPGALRRMESRVQRENNQGFWLPPSRNYVDTAGSVARTISGGGAMPYLQ